ncbi:MAG: ATPase [Epsilonproteobacteria bacterium]|nr:MAG: ATPase [Campylobacterota bacterium]
MSKLPTLLEQFRSFCFQNNAANFEEAIEYFAVFGGMGWTVDLSRPLDELIKEKVLKNYRYIHGDIAKITQSDKTHHALLSALAVGDRREHSAFKRAGVSRQEGEASVSFLVKSGLLVRERSQEQPLDETEEVSDKLLFTQPFMRFWFSSVSPYYKSIRDGDYAEVKERLKNMKQDFSDLIYDRLVLELVKKSFQDDSIESIGSYWDKKSEIDILAMTVSGKSIAGTTKLSKSKAKKSELNILKEKCSQAKLKAETFVIFSKNGFSNELKKEKSASVKLFALKNLKMLLDDLSEKDLLVNTNKRY